MAVIRLRSLGDCVLCTPAIALLRQARPDLDIAVVVEERFADVFDKTLRPSVMALRAFAPDLCLNLHGGTRSARLTLLSGARFRAGFDIFKPAIYNVSIPTAQQILGVTRRVHTAEHMACAMFFLGVPVTEVPRACMPAALGRASFVPKMPVPKMPAPKMPAPKIPYSVIHPMAATAEKTWPAAGFLEVAGYLRRESGLEPVFIAGPGEDLSPFRSFRCVAGAPLAEMAGLLRDAALFIGNDSGPAHVAAAFGTPQVVFFGPSDEEIWHPWRTAHRILKADPIQSITPAQAIEAIDALQGRA